MTIATPPHPTGRIPMEKKMSPTTHFTTRPAFMNDGMIRNVQETLHTAQRVEKIGTAVFVLPLASLFGALAMAVLVPELKESLTSGVHAILGNSKWFAALSGTILIGEMLACSAHNRVMTCREKLGSDQKIKRAWADYQKMLNKRVRENTGRTRHANRSCRFSQSSDLLRYGQRPSP